ncbi:MAG: hypothetical protein COX30_01950 [Candidatus Moranbacteria bacterium CG23_combo_of_CG06-09_8_20_14_all_39_10]|nr:MAG: hypothetical protein COX30_01950 [Candidatus Moranbacteria bacterium CG23_combo_of_CG06-09_8_20_14_all_39_10]
MKNISLLLQEAQEFYAMGTEFGFANPQSMSGGDYNGKEALVNGIKTVDMTRLDYLDLGQSPEIKGIMKGCIERYISCPTSQMALKSESTVHLERALAEFHGMADSVIYLSGYCANESVIQALALRMKTSHLGPYVVETDMGKKTRNIPTEFFVDDETHYSIINAIKFAKMKVKDGCLFHRFPTADYGRLTELLDKSKEELGDRSIRIIVSDTISSMSGRVYDVPALCQIAEDYDCFLYLDEAHAIGTVGEQGRGIASEMKDFERYKNRLIIMGTLTKAVSQLGGYVVVPDERLSCFLRACSPQYIFSAPLSPWMAEAVIQIIDLIRSDYGKAKRELLTNVSAYMRESLQKAGFNTLGSESQIVPVLIGKESDGIKTKAFLEAAGFTPSLFICPAVPKDESILRFSLCSDITCQEVDSVVRLLLQARGLYGF